MSAQDFTVQARPGKASVLPGGNVVLTPVVQGSGGYSGTTALSASGLPTGVTASFAPASVSGSWAVSLLTLSTTSSTPAGTYSITLSGVGGGLTRTTTFSLTVAPSFTFTHPGILLGATQLANIESKVAQSTSPWSSAYSAASGSSYGSLTYAATPHASVDTTTTASTDLINDSEAAYTQALLWYITRNSTYANNAIAIMNAWSSTMTGGFSGSNDYNVAAWAGDNFPRAAEIIRYTYLDSSGAALWSSTDITQFKSFLTSQFVPMLTNDRGQGDYGGNLHASTAAAEINIGVFLDDPATFFRGLWMWRYALPAYVYEPGDGSYPAPPIDWTASYSSITNMVTLWYGQPMFSEGLSQETCRDLGHTRWGFAALANGAETAYLQGVDLYAESSLGTSNATRMQDGLEFNSTYLNGATPPSTLCSGTLTAGSSVGTGEIAYNALVNRRGLSLPETSTFLSGQRPTGANYFMNWETLTHYMNAATSTASIAVSPASIVAGTASFPLAATISFANTATPTGAVTFLVSGSAYSASCSTTSSTTIACSSADTGSASLAAGTYTITASQAADSFYGYVAGTNSLVVTPAPDFTFVSSGSASQSIVSGSTATFLFSLTPTGSAYPGAVSFSVSCLPQGASCSVTPLSLLATAGAQTVTLTVQTPARTAMSRAPRGPESLLLAGLIFLPMGLRRRRKRRLRPALLALLSVGVLPLLIGCGSSSTSATTAYTLTLIATSGAVQHSRTVTLTLQ
ncbi:MAG: alginate lyase family protein [Acidobacteriaceae bacterium]|nr:alginate lyase family protein [Acidobacteriaceae bacterium]